MSSIIFNGIEVFNAEYSEIRDYPFPNSFKCAGHDACSCKKIGSISGVNIPLITSGTEAKAFAVNLKFSKTLWQPATEFRPIRDCHLQKADLEFSQALNDYSVTVNFMSEDEKKYWKEKEKERFKEKRENTGKKTS